MSCFCSLFFPTASAESFGRKAEVAFVRLKRQRGRILTVPFSQIPGTVSTHTHSATGVYWQGCGTPRPLPVCLHWRTWGKNPSSIWHDDGMQCSTPFNSLESHGMLSSGTGRCFILTFCFPCGYSNNRQAEAATSCLFRRWRSVGRLTYRWASVPLWCRGKWRKWPPGCFFRRRHS